MFCQTELQFTFANKGVVVRWLYNGCKEVALSSSVKSNILNSLIKEGGNCNNGYFLDYRDISESKLRALLAIKPNFKNQTRQRAPSVQ